jgi:hypothetical protein
MSGLDILIVMPLLPLAPVVATWWLPWERWIPSWGVPKVVLGPYLLYAAFASWHFGLAWWATLILAAWGAGVCAFAYLESVAKEPDVDSIDRVRGADSESSSLQALHESINGQRLLRGEPLLTDPIPKQIEPSATRSTNEEQKR